MSLHPQLKSWLPLGGLLFGPILIGLGAFNLEGAIASQKWQRVRAVITHSAIDAGAGRDHAHTPSIRYAYDSDGRHFENERIRYGNFSTGKSASALVARYAAGDSVDVFVDTKHPARSVLHTGGIGVGSAELASGLLLFSAFASAARREMRERRRITA